MPAVMRSSWSRGATSRASHSGSGRQPASVNTMISPCAARHPGVALVRDGNTYSRRLLELHPPYLGLVTQPDVIKPAVGSVNNDDLC